MLPSRIPRDAPAHISVNRDILQVCFAPLTMGGEQWFRLHAYCTRRSWLIEYYSIDAWKQDSLFWRLSRDCSRRLLSSCCRCRWRKNQRSAETAGGKRATTTTTMNEWRERIRDRFLCGSNDYSAGISAVNLTSKRKKARRFCASIVESYASVFK